MEDLLKYENLFYDPEYFQEEEPIQEHIEDSCKHEWIEMESHPSCIRCGIVDFYKQIFVSDNSNRSKPKRNCVYHRKTYFATILKLMCGFKQCQIDTYPEILERISTHNFETIFELKKIMGKLGLQKFYKYIYSIFYDIKKVRLIDLKLSDIVFLSNKFLVLESEFKKLFPGRSNLVSYSLVSYCLFKKYGYPFYDFVIVPKKKTTLINVINNLLKNIENY